MIHTVDFLIWRIHQARNSLPNQRQAHLGEYAYGIHHDLSPRTFMVCLKFTHEPKYKNNYGFHYKTVEHFVRAK